MRPLLGAPQGLGDWAAFAASWNDLELDTHLPDGHRYRRRRHATLSARAGEGDLPRRGAPAHYQSLDYNTLVGRHRAMVRADAAPRSSPGPFRTVLRFCLGLFGGFRPDADWHIECHQFRIEARSDAAGLPTPEGVHRDGVDYVLVMLVSRVNIESGTTTVHDAAESCSAASRSPRRSTPRWWTTSACATA
jgi:hypothetical protein